MAIEYLDGERIIGLSTDTKPTDVASGSTFIETDTGNIEFFNGTCWFTKPFESINASFGRNLGATANQHMIEWFCGKSLNTDRWNLEAVAGSIDAATGMYDGVDYGFYIKNSSNSDHTQIDFGVSGSRKRQYSPNSQCIVTSKMGCGSNYDMRDGLLNWYDAHYFYASVNWANSNSKMSLESANGGSTTSTDSDLALDENWHTKHLKLNGSSGTMDIDGIVRATTTSNLPNGNNEKMMPFHAGVIPASGYSSNRGCFIRYMECWNN